MKTITLRTFLIICFIIFSVTSTQAITGEQESFNLYMSGIHNIEKAEFEKAIKDLDQAINLQDDDPSYYIARGIAFGKTGNYKKGIEDMKKARELDHAINEVYWVLAEYYVKIQKEEQGIELFNEFMKEYPDNPYIFLNAGQLHYFMAEHEKALELFIRSTEIDPEFKYGYVAQSAVLIMQEKLDDAEMVLKKAIKIDKDYAEGYLYLAEVYRLKGEEGLSQENRVMAIKLKPRLEYVDLAESLTLRAGKVSMTFMATTLDLVYLRLLTLEERDAYFSKEYEKIFTPNVGVGSMTIEDEKWHNVSFEPEVQMKNLGFQLSFRYLFNQDGDIKKEELDHHKILQMLRFGREYSWGLLYIGNIENVSIGYGFIVRDYMNRIDEDQQRTGGHFILQTTRGTIGLEGIVNDVEDPKFYAGRFYMGNFGRRRNSFLQRFEFGLTYATDTDPDSNPETSDTLTAYGVDILIHLGSLDKFSFAIFGEGAEIQDYGNGYIGGPLITFGKVHLNRQTWDMHFQIFGGIIDKGENFEPAIFDSFYESEKFRVSELSSLNTTSALIETKEERLTGQIFIVSYKLSSYFGTNIVYEQFPDTEELGTLSFSLGTLVDAPFDLGIFYVKTNIEDIGNIELEDINTYMQAYLSIPFLWELFRFNAEYKRTYIWDDLQTDYIPQDRFDPSIVFTYRF